MSNADRTAKLTVIDEAYLDGTISLEEHSEKIRAVYWGFNFTAEDRSDNEVLTETVVISTHNETRG